jgi:3-oxoadipate enol-lactonase
VMDGRPPLPPADVVHLAGRGRTLVYDTGGPGRPVLLLHGWTSTAALNWYATFPALAVSHRVVALDQRGHGQGIRSRTPFRLEDCADDAAALVEHLGAGPATVVGYSMGGPVAQLMWRRHPELVDGLVLCATAARFAVQGQFSGTVGTIGLGASMALSYLPAPLRRRGMLLASRTWSNSTPWSIEEWSRHDPSALIQAVLALSRFDSSGWLGEVDVPTAVVVTTLDQTVSPLRQRYLASRIPGAVEIPVEGDHRACVEHPVRFAAALEAALSAVRRAASMPECPAQ